MERTVERGSVENDFAVGNVLSFSWSTEVTDTLSAYEESEGRNTMASLQYHEHTHTHTLASFGTDYFMTSFPSVI